MNALAKTLFCRTILHATLASVAFAFLAPLLWIGSTSLKSEDEIYGAPNQWFPALPRPPVRGDGVLDGRPLLLGAVRLVSDEGSEYEPSAGQVITERLEPVAGRVRLSDTEKNGLPYATVEYDFEPAAAWSVGMVVDVPFAVNRLRAVQLAYQPDDSWHGLTCRIERAGAPTLTSLRPYPLAGTRIQSRQWRLEDPYDDTPRVRDWIELVPEPAAPKSDLQPGQARVVFSLSPSSMFEAASMKSRFHYDRVFAAIPFWRYLASGLFLALMNALLTTVSSAMAAYAFGRLKWAGREAVFALLMASALFPPQVTLVPRFLIWQKLGACDTLLPLWLPAAFGSAFFVILLREAVRAIPRELEDAARIDGCGAWGLFWHVTVPQIAPSLAAIASFAFLGSWNDFLGPLLFLSDQRQYPLAFGVFALSVFSGAEPAITSASAVLVLAPPLACFFLLQRQVMKVSLAPAIKG